MFSFRKGRSQRLFFKFIPCSKRRGKIGKHLAADEAIHIEKKWRIAVI
jgi:hypothetical protein